VEFEEVKTVEYKTGTKKTDVVIGRSGEIRIVDMKTGAILATSNIPYGAHLFVKDKQEVEKAQPLCQWDPYNAVIASEFGGKVDFEHIEEGITFREESDEQTGYKEKVIIDSRDKTKNPVIKIMGGDKEMLKSYNIPVGAHIMVNKGNKINAGEILVKIPRATGRSGDITGGLPRVTELFEARNPSNPAVVSEIDGVVSYGGIKR
jgi:DNA-directed RNA polymerase subunit beta'